jgi:hypothetical protein
MLNNVTSTLVLPVKFCCYTMVSFISVHWQKLRCLLSFEFMILILENDVSGSLCLSLHTKYHDLIEPTKTMKNSIQRI